MNWFNSLSPTTQFVIFSAVKIVGRVRRGDDVGGVFRSGRAQNLRVHPGPASAQPRSARSGIWQPLADGVKAFLKEDFTPGHVRKIYFWLAPMIAMIPALLVLAVIPFGSQIGAQKMVIADLNVGILYTFGIVSLGVYGIVLAGYASNSKYPFLGGIRSSAQMISYEIAMGMSVIPVFLHRGRFEPQQGHRASGRSTAGSSFTRRCRLLFS